MSSGHFITIPGKIQEVRAIFTQWKRILTEMLSHSEALAELELHDRPRPWLDNSLSQVRQTKAAG